MLQNTHNLFNCRVDHWDNETEKIVLLTEDSVYSVRFDFVAMKIYKLKKKALHEIDTVQLGEFKYPKTSLV